jgi:putative transposase
MPWGLQRFQESGQTHFVTFTCYHRRPLLESDAARQTFERALERVRRAFELCVYGYVVMPDHVHLLLSEPGQDSLGTSPLKPKPGLSGPPSPPSPKPGLSGPPSLPSLADALKSLKQGVSRRLIGGAEHFWQKRYYDRNVRDYDEFVEKLRYLHRNPVKRGLCARPEDWEWSSFRQWATGCAGRVEIECAWTANKRERAAGRLAPAIELPHSSQRRA